MAPATWVNSCPPTAVSPPAEPGSTLRAPASALLPTFSNGAPAARSAKVSWLKSPAASSKPNSSSVSTAPATWVKNWLPMVVSPVAEPYSTFTAPAATMLPTLSPGAPTARSAKVSALKSPADSGEPTRRAGQHAEGPGVGPAADVLEWGAGGQVGEGVVVEVPGRQLEA